VEVGRLYATLRQAMCLLVVATLIHRMRIEKDQIRIGELVAGGSSRVEEEVGAA
jgi:hypothetical protein